MKVYYCNYETDVNVPFDEPIEMNYEEAIKAFLDIAGYGENFYGLEIQPDTAVQFVYVDEDEWLIDIPDTEKGGSHSKECDQEECLSMIRKVYDTGKLPELDGFSFESFN